MVKIGYGYLMVKSENGYLMVKGENGYLMVKFEMAVNPSKFGPLSEKFVNIQQLW